MNLASKSLRRWLLFSFLTLSLADLYLTRRLFEQEGACFAERNPLADWMLCNHGWTGMACFKLWTVGVFGMLVAAVGSRRPRTASRLLTASCLLVSVVVFYSSALLYFPGVVSAESEERVREIRTLNRALDVAIAENRKRWAVKHRIARDVVANRQSFSEAVAAMHDMHGPECTQLAHMHCLYPGCTDEQCVAVNIMEFALTQNRTNRERMNQLVAELARAYELSYGVPVPACWWQVGERIVSHSFQEDPAVSWQPPNHERGKAAELRVATAH